MPMLEVKLVPSVNTEKTLAANPTGISESNFIRWKMDMVEKRGGCTLYIKDQLSGVPSDIQTWGDLDGNPYVGVGTTEKVYSYSTIDKILQDISPQYLVRSSVTPKISTVAGSSQVTVVDTTTPYLTVYDYVTFDTPYSIGGLILSGTYPIVVAGGVSTYIFDAGVNAIKTESEGTLPSFSVVSGSSEVICTFPIKYQTGTLTVGDNIGFIVPTNIGGLTVVGQYIVSKIRSATEFVFVDNQTPTSSGTKFMNDNKLSLRYWIAQGPVIVGSGYGDNEYGEFGYGASDKEREPIKGDVYKADSWWLDSRGSSLIASATAGPIFFYNNSYGFKNLTILNNAPLASNGSFVSMPYGHIMAWGCTDPINPIQAPLYIRWSNATDPNNWSIAGNSDAGFYNIPTGSKIVRGIQGPTQQYWFTDIDLYAAQYIGYPGVYGFNKIGNGCGLVAPRAVGLLAGSIYWMSQREFFVCPQGGSPQPIPCTVWDFIFQNIDSSQLSKVVCGTNSLFNEVNWFFQTANKSPNLNPDYPYNPESTAYVCYNVQYQEWDFGYLNRVAWFDQSLVGEPLSADSAGYIYQQDTDYNLAVGDKTLPISAWFKTGYFSITNGQDLSFVDWFLPDFRWGEWDQPKDADLSVTFYVTDYAGQEPRIYGPYPFNKQTQFINPRFRGRFISMKVEGVDLNSFWRLGSCRYRLAPSGRR